MDIVAGEFIRAVAMILYYVLSLYMWIIIARVVLSWVNPRPQSEIIQSILYFIYRVTDPLLYWVRRKIPINLGMIDISPFIVILAILFVQNFVVNSLIRLSLRLGLG